MSLDPTHVDRALRGDETALRVLVDALTPAIQVRVATVLVRLAGRKGDVRAEVAELVQEVFIHLFADDGAVLRAWDPAQLPLDRFVGLVAQRRAIALTRTARSRATRNLEPLAEEPHDPRGHASPERALGDRDLVSKLMARLEAELSPLGRRLFVMLFVEEQPVEDIVRATDMSADAIYAWRSRLRRTCRAMIIELGGSVAHEPA